MANLPCREGLPFFSKARKNSFFYDVFSWILRIFATRYGESPLN
jgi:hypothetical protein